MSPCLFMKHFQQLYVRHTFVAISFRNIFLWEDSSAVILRLLQNRMTFAIEKENAYWSSELPWIMLSIYYFCFFSTVVVPPVLSVFMIASDIRQRFIKTQVYVTFHHHAFGNHFRSHTTFFTIVSEYLKDILL